MNTRLRVRAKANPGVYAEYGIPAWSLKNESMPFRKSARDLGVQGEEHIGRELSRLSREYGFHLAHDLGVPNGRSNIDHVVIMRNCVLILDSKNYSGVVSIEESQSGNRVLKVDGYSKMAMLKKFKTVAADLENFLRQQFDQISVKPVLVFHDPKVALANRLEMHLDLTESVSGVEIAQGNVESFLAYWSTRKGKDFDQAEVTKYLLSRYPAKSQ